jgi:hypothetical protein
VQDYFSVMITQAGGYPTVMQQVSKQAQQAALY